MVSKQHSWTSPTSSVYTPRTRTYFPCLDASDWELQFLAENIDKKKEEVYLGQKVPSSDTNYVLSTVGALITQVNYFSYPVPWRAKSSKAKFGSQHKRHLT